jgi:hypothetical protein
MSNTSEKITSLEAAIESINCEKGAWSVSAGNGYVTLEWKCDENSTGEMYGDEPWSEWGGNAIVAAAGIGEPDCSGCDAYKDRFGEEVVSQWVQWNFEDDSEDDS